MATLTVSTLSVGTHPITASYGGDTNYTTAVSTAVSQVVNKAASTVTLASAPNPSTFGASVTFTATVTAGATGTVTFEDGATSLGTGTIASGVATLTVSTLSVGTHPITANYGGDTNYTTAVSTAVSQVVNKAASTVTLASLPNPSTFGAVVTFTATVTSGATGTVTFEDGATSLGTGTIASGVATLTVSTLAVGTHPITASYGGDTNYNSAVSTAVSQVVNKAISTVTLASSPNPSAFGTSVTLTATVTAGATGTVTFEDGATSLGTGTIASGVATLTVSTLAVGTHPITASYGGDTNYTAAVSTAVSQVVNKAAATVTLISAPNPSTFGAVVTLTATVTAGATGTVTFEDGATSLGTGTIASGVATLAVSTLSVGTHSITASYGGDINYTTAVSTAVSQVVNKAASTVTLASLPNPSTFGASVTFTASVTAGATGTVTFEDGATSLGTGTIASGVATLTVSTLTVGTHSITASYGGDTNYTAAVSTAVSQVVNKAASTVALISSPNPSTFGASVTLTATVTPGATGTVTFEDGATSLGTGTIASAVATLTVSTLAVGTHSITASYGGDTNYTTAASTAVSQVVNKAASTVALISAPNPSTFGAGVTFTATVTAGATGTVTFEDNGTAISGAVPISGTTATFTTSTLSVGTHSITASYGGDTSYNSAVSTAVSQVVDKAAATVTLASAPNPSTFGTSVTLTATVTSAATGTVTFEDNGTAISGAVPISGTTATFTTSTLVAGMHPIIAVYSGDSNYNGVSSSVPTQGVNKATLTVTANDTSRPYGVPNPAFTSTITGFVNGDTQGSVTTGAPSLTTSATATSPAGMTYSIVATQGTLVANNNYSFVFVDGTLTVTPAVGATTTLSVNPGTVMYGNPAVLTAVVGPASGATGTVSFYEGITLLGSASLNSSATAVLPVSTLNAGMHTITATYNGDVSFPATASNPVTLTVTQRTGAGGGASLTVTVNDASRTTTQDNPPFSHTVAGELVNGDTYDTAVTGTPAYSTTAGTSAGIFAITVSGLTSQNYVLAFVPGTLTVVPTPSTTTLASSPNSSLYGDPVTLTATVTSGATGTASFYDGSVYLGQGSVTGGVATLSMTTLNVGVHTITATYNGDATYASSMSGPATVTVAKNTAPGSSLTVTVLNESREYGTANPEFSYIVSGTLLNGDTYATAVTGVPVYTSTDTPTSPVGSTFPINVSGLVSENYTLTTVPGTLTIVTAPTTTALTTSVTSTQYGDPVTLTATVAPNSATGTVVFSNGSTALGTGTVSGGTATLSTSALSVGTYTITASYEGDGNYGESTSSAVTVTVTPRTGPGGVAALTVTVTNASRQYGQGNPAFSYTVSGTLVNGDTYATAVTGVPVYSTTATVTSPVGTYPISITGGLSSANYSLAFVNGTLTVSKGTPSVTVASSQNPSTPAASVTFTATLSAGATGTVTFMDGTTAFGTGTVSSGTASFSTSTLSVGTHSITAVYSGDANYNAATSPAIVQTVNKAASTVTLASLPNPSTFGASVTFTATVTSGATGTVSFLDGTTTLGTRTISSGIATLTISSLTLGTHSITAQYGGDSNYNAAVSTPISQVVNQVSGTVTLVSSPNPSIFGTSVTLTATVTSGATGTVTFDDGATSLGTGTISSGVAVLTTSSLAVGTHSISAQYGGDSNYNAAVSTPVSQVGEQGFQRPLLSHLRRTHRPSVPA